MIDFALSCAPFPMPDSRQHHVLDGWSGTFRHFITGFAMSATLIIRPLQITDYAAWRPLWDGYNAFYGRHGDTALPEAITQVTWQRFFDPYEPLFALVAEQDCQLLGLTHCLYHRSTTRIEPTCYLQDLFTSVEARGKGVARALIQGVYDKVKLEGGKRVYWQTHETNSTARALYEKVAINDGFIVYGTLV